MSEVSKEQRLKWVRELRASAAYQGIIVQELERRREFHTEACRDRGLSAEKRAEHAEASHLADELLGFLDTHEKSLLTSLKRD